MKFSEHKRNYKESNAVGTAIFGLKPFYRGILRKIAGYWHKHSVGRPIEWETRAKHDASLSSQNSGGTAEGLP